MTAVADGQGGSSSTPSGTASPTPFLSHSQNLEGGARAVNISPAESPAVMIEQRNPESPAATGDGAQSPPGSPSPIENPNLKRSFINVDQKMKDIDVERLLGDIAQMEQTGAGVGGGRAWYDTTARPVEGDAKDAKIARKTKALRVGFNENNLLVINIRGHVSRYDIMFLLTKFLQVGLLLGICYFALPGPMSPGGEVFSPLITIVFGAMVGTLISRVCGIPQLIGMLIAGILWGALPLDISGGTPLLFITTVRTIALTVILCRAGINFNWKVMKPVVLNVSLLGVLPQLAEMLAHGAMAKLVFPHPSWLSAILQGACTAPVSNAVMIPVLSGFRAEGYSVNRGPTLLMMVSGAADNVIGVWIINFILGIMFPVSSKLSLAMTILMAPIQILGGFLLGLICGRLTVAFFNQYHKRTNEYKGLDAELTARAARRDTMWMVLGMALFNIFLFNHFNLPGTGTVAAATSSAVIAHYWAKQGEMERKNCLNQDMARLWDLVIAPCLFPLVGAEVRLEKVFTAAFFPPALACLSTGLACKALVVVLLQAGAGFTTKEKIFFAIGFSSKATVQAAIGGKALAAAKQVLDGIADTTSPEYALAAAQVAAGDIILSMSVMAIVLCALGSGIALKVTGRRLLVKDTDHAALTAHAHQPSQHHSHPPANGETNGSAHEEKIIQAASQEASRKGE